MTVAQAEIDSGQRFSFGKNWASFLKTLDADRIDIAVASLRELLGVDSLQGRTFLDIGCGSGLFSLAARRLGARVTSFDFDADSVDCAQQLRARFDPAPENWTIQQGSALSFEFFQQLGKFDVVYAWGVLHHTGQMWQALNLAGQAVRPGGLLAIAIYHDQGWRSRAWLRVKQIYCSGPLGRWLMKAVFYPWFALRAGLVSLIRGQNEFTGYRRRRGMSITHDWADWLGGLPYEVASYQQLIDFFEARGFSLRRGRPTRRLGCHELTFQAATHSTHEPTG